MPPEINANALPPDDVGLACRAQQGCLESFEELVRRYQVPLLRYVQRRGVAQADAEDIVQETFLRAYRRLSTYDSKWCFSTWLFTIARNRTIDSRPRYPAPLGEESLRCVEMEQPEPEHRLLEEESRQNIWNVAETWLSEEQYSALWLYYVEDLSTKEIAHVLGRSLSAIKTMLHRARKKLLPLLRPAS